MTSLLASRKHLGSTILTSSKAGSENGRTNGVSGDTKSFCALIHGLVPWAYGQHGMKLVVHFGVKTLIAILLLNTSIAANQPAA